MIDFKILVGYLNKFKSCGYEQSDNGAILIGRAPHIAPKAWLNVLFPPLDEKEIKILEEKIKIIIPESFRQFLLFSNGASFFSTTLNIYGSRQNFKRSYKNVWQPFDIVVPNTIERIHDAKDNYLFIGSYDWDGSLLYINNETKKVYRCTKDSVRALNEWGSLLEMLDSEISRLIATHNDQGMPLDETLPTTP